MAPTLVNVYTNAQGNNTTSLTFTVTGVAVGDVLVFKAGNGWYGNTRTVNNPTTTGETWTSRATVTVASGCYAALSTMVATSAGTKTVTATVSGSSVQHSGVVEHWTNAQLDATPVVVSVNNGGSAPSGSITTEAAGSVVSWASFDWNAVDYTTRTYRSSATEEFVTGTAGVDYGAYFARQSAASAGAQTFGLTAPTGQLPAMVAIEIQSAGGGGTNLTDTPADNLPLTDSTTPVADRARTPGDALGLTDAPTPVADRPRSQGDPLGLTDSVTAGFDRAASPADPLGLTDGLTVAWDRAATIGDGLGLTDPGQTGDRTTTVADPLGLTDTATATQSGTGDANLSDPVGLTDAVTVLWQRVTTVDDLLTLTDAASGSQANDATKTPSDPLGLTDAAAWSAGRDRTQGDPLGLADSVVAVLERNVTIADGLALTDAATGSQAGPNDGAPVLHPTLAGTATTATLDGAATEPTLTGSTTNPTLTEG